MSANTSTPSPRAPSKLVTHRRSSRTWTWVTKDGRNKGKSFQVPTTPVACAKNAPRAVRWMVAVFHSFKAHLNPIAIDADSGRVHQGWLHLYQSNMYLHLQTQIKALQPRHPPIPPNPPNPTAHPPPEILCLSYERRFIPYVRSSTITSSPTRHAALVAATNHLMPPRRLTPSKGLTPPSPSPPAFTLVEAGPDGREDRRMHLTMPAPLSTSLPEPVLEAIKLRFVGSPPFYLGISRLGALAVATTADRSLVSTILNFPSDPSVPTRRP
ncbi:hypothetical protein EDD15DRAFT_2380030 [Pisolithus albus]|nr:hypothetical protein EDD15DRAFT_2380030 [Pisolithus albus]